MLPHTRASYHTGADVWLCALCVQLGTTLADRCLSARPGTPGLPKDLFRTNSAQTAAGDDLAQRGIERPVATSAPPSGYRVSQLLRPPRQVPPLQEEARAADGDLRQQRLSV